eukprot:GAHX01001435.1.p1 GENE.GAHX01001435.1~~GAHX01001435.1.p1  ORF type:complete len:475 (-),score=94.96 GAHX01001435.1:49-1473(-)
MTKHSKSSNSEHKSIGTISDYADEFKRQYPPSGRNPPFFNTNVPMLIKKKQYIDKTKQLMGFLTSSNIMACLRPRRMGKKFTINTIQAIAKGEEVKELLKDTALCTDYLENENGEYIDNNGEVIKANSNNEIVPVKYDWKTYPVFRISFIAAISKYNEKETYGDILGKISSSVFKYDLEDKLRKEVKGSKTIETYLTKVFELLVNSEGKENKVIVLIDEYDTVFHDDEFDDEEIKQKNVSIVMEFYKILKDLNQKGYIKSIFITGITNLFFAKEISPKTGWKDYSFHPSTADLIGFTEKDILSHFTDEDFRCIYVNAVKCGLNFIKDKSIVEIRQKAMEALKQMYCGYRFTPKKIHVFNSETIWKCFREGKIQSFWPETVDTNFQWESILKYPNTFKEFIETGKILNVNKGVLIGSQGYLEGEYNNGIAHSYRTGLLTIKSYDEKAGTFDLEIPNLEVKQNFEIAKKWANDANY